MSLSFYESNTFLKESYFKPLFITVLNVGLKNQQNKNELIIENMSFNEVRVVLDEN